MVETFPRWTGGWCFGNCQGLQEHSCRECPAGGRDDLLYLDTGTFTYIVWECGRATVINIFLPKVLDCGVTVFHYF